MDAEMGMRPLLLLPEMLLLVGGLGALIGGSFVPRQRQWLIRVLTAVVLVAAMAAAAVQLGGPVQRAFEGTYAVDTATGVARILAAFGTLLVLTLAADEIAASARESETYALLLFVTTGTVVLAGADDLLVLAVGFLLATIPLYGLIGLVNTASGAEAAMKTYLMGALFGILLLLGVTILSGVAGTTMYGDLTDRLTQAPAVAVAAATVGVVAGLMFKAGGVPAHFWVPDAAQGAGGTVATFLTTVPKIGALIAVYRFVLVLPRTTSWALLVAIFAVASMTLGNLAAYWQNDPRRLLGWSTVSQVGFLLVPVAVAGRSDLALPSLLVYLAGYTVTNIAAFAVTAALPEHRELTAYGGLARRRPWLAAALLVALLGLVGTPPTAVFVGKLTTATAAWDGDYAWLAVVAFVNTVLSLFYYLRWIVPAYRTADADMVATEQVSPRRWSARTAVIAAALSLAAGLAAGPLWQLASQQ
ncbi:NADH-quinone oxidoreductase subunit N [Micromonospora sicca]|uniref:NADH-quinone oxidoreductase subunit N n=2 Tax=Micromonospora sicca TaxID=2202420 RepID=A0A317DFS4_9ACTN|nr:NADH-quinone oxidoreductase subunit N [Micromonospora sp. 4G51]PWR13551.1 NADH-quinone oxidoreductase subunit N [Micromonospora sp. 4G51]